MKLFILPANLNRDGNQGFSIVELAVASFIIALAIASTAGLFTTATRSIRLSGEKARVNSIVDSDISKLKDLSEAYNSCNNGLGSVVSCSTPIAYDTSGNPNSYYYVSSDSAIKTAFYGACTSTSLSGHLTANLMSSMTSPLSLGSGVMRQSVIRDHPNPTSASGALDHVIRVTYTYNGSVVRVVKLLPVVSAWCP